MESVEINKTCQLHGRIHDLFTTREIHTTQVAAAEAEALWTCGVHWACCALHVSYAFTCLTCCTCVDYKLYSVAKKKSKKREQSVLSDINCERSFHSSCTWNDHCGRLSGGETFRTLHAIMFVVWGRLKGLVDFNCSIWFLTCRSSHSATNICYRRVVVNIIRFVEPMAKPIRMNAGCVRPTSKLNFYLFFILFIFYLGILCFQG